MPDEGISGGNGKGLLAMWTDFLREVAIDEPGAATWEDDGSVDGEVVVLIGGQQPLVLAAHDAPGRLKQHTFPAVKAEKVRITVLRRKGTVKIAEFGVYAAD